MKKVNGDKGGQKKKKRRPNFFFLTENSLQEFWWSPRVSARVLDFIGAPSSSLLLINLFMKSFIFGRKKKFG